MTYLQALQTLREEASYGLDLPFLDDDARMLALLKRSADRVARDAEVYDGSVTLLPVAGQGSYPTEGPMLSRPIDRALRLIRDGRELCGVRPIGAYSVELNPSGAVRRAYMAPGALVLIPPPSADEAAREWRVEALVLANAPLPGGSNEMGLPPELAEAVPMRALLGARSRATEGEQFARLKAFEETVDDLCRRHRARSRRDRYALGEPGDRRLTR